MAQGASGARALPPVRRDDHFLFDLKNAARVWLSEAVKRNEVSAKAAQEAIRNMDGAKAADVGEDQLKLWLGPVKDSFGMVKIAQKLMSDFNRWWRVKVEFKAGPKGDLIHIKGWPNGRKILPGTRYRVDNAKIMELQIGKPGLKAAAKESAHFGLILVVGLDLVQFARDHNLAHLLASLTIDIPSVALASAIGGLAGTVTAGWPVVAAFALGPALIAVGIGVVVGLTLYALDQHFHLNERLTAAYQRGLDSLEQRWEAGEQSLGNILFSGIYEDMQRSVNQAIQRLSGSAY